MQFGVQGDKHWRVERVEAEGGGRIRDSAGIHAATICDAPSRRLLQQHLRPRLQGPGLWPGFRTCAAQGRHHQHWDLRPSS